MLNKRLIRFIGGAKKFVGLTVAFQWFALAANILVMVSFAFILNRLLENDLRTVSLLGAAALILIAVSLKSVFHTLAAKYSLRASSLAKEVLRDKVYGKLLKLGMAYQEKISTSETVQAAVEGVEQLEIYFGKYLPQFFYSMLAPITLFIVLAFVNLKAALVLLFCVPLIPITIIIIQKIAKRTGGKYWKSYANLGQRFLENLQGLTTLKIYQADQRKAEEMDLEAEDFRKATMNVLYMQLNSIIVMDLIAYGGAAAGIIVSVLEYTNGRISFSEAFLIIVLSAEFFLPLRALGSLFHVAMNGMAASEKIFFLLDLKEEEEKSYTGIKKVDKIQCQDLTFSYNKERVILKGIHLELNKNQLISLVGESGCGKSTLTTLLTGRQKEYEGSILINGTELALFPEEELLRLVTLVCHNSYLFKGTVEENLRMGKKDAAKEEMEQVLKKVDLYDFISSKGGLNFKLLEKASNLSGGQAQRLALARALLHDTPVYIFDEVTSNVDVDSEKHIMSVIYELAKEKIVLLISHRLLNVVDSQCIYVIDQGRLVQKGSHKELMEQEGTYKKLFDKQRELELYSLNRDKKEAPFLHKEIKSGFQIKEKKVGFNHA